MLLAGNLLSRLFFSLLPAKKTTKCCAAVIALLCGPSFAAPGDPLACMPAEWGGSGTYFAMVKNADGVSAAWGCPPNGMISSIKVLNDFAPTLASCPKNIADLTATVFDNSASLEVARKILATCGAVPAVGTPRRAVYDELEALATAAVQKKYRDAHPLPPDPPASGPPPVQWVTPASDIFTIWTFAGNKVNGISKAKAPPNAACIEPCPMFKSGTRNLCRLADGLPNEVTTCLPKP